jgi:hypothetical protein
MSSCEVDWLEVLDEFVVEEDEAGGGVCCAVPLTASAAHNIIPIAAKANWRNVPPRILNLMG